MRRDRQRLEDFIAAIDAIHSHFERGDLSDRLVFDAVRVRLLEIGEAVNALPAELLASEAALLWLQIAGMRDRVAHKRLDRRPVPIHDVLRHTAVALYRSRSGSPRMRSALGAIGITPNTPTASAM